MVQDTTSGFAQSIAPQSDPNLSGKWVSYFLTGPNDTDFSPDFLYSVGLERNNEDVTPRARPRAR